MAVRSFVIGGGFTYSQTSARHTRNKEGCGGREGEAPYCRGTCYDGKERESRILVLDPNRVIENSLRQGKRDQAQCSPYSAAASPGIVFHRELSMAFINFSSLPPFPAFLTLHPTRRLCQLSSSSSDIQTAHDEHSVQGMFYILGSWRYFVQVHREL